MALVVVSDPGLPTSNSYASLDEAEVYMESRVHKTAWTAASDDDKSACLVWATRLLDMLVTWRGSRTNSSVQALEWPRSGVADRAGVALNSSTIPEFLRNATSELALALLGEDRSADYALAGFDKIKVDVIELVAAASTKPRPLPQSVIDMVDFYGTVKAASDMRRVVR